MLSFQSMYGLAQKYCQNNQAEDLDFLKQQINIGEKILESELGVYSSEKPYSDLTEANVNGYPLPPDFIRLKKIYVTVSTVDYPATEIFDEGLWRQIQANTASSHSDIVSHVYVDRNKFYLYPTPTTAGNTINLLYEPIVKDLSADDYTTGSILTLANNSQAVVGTATAFTSLMVGRFFKITADGQWYEISAVTDATHLTLARQYQGSSISLGTSAYVIGEMPRTPEPTHFIPCLYAAWQYHAGYRFSETKAAMYEKQYEKYMQWAKSTFNRRYSVGYIPSQRYLNQANSLINPNWHPLGMS